MRFRDRPERIAEGLKATARRLSGALRECESGSRDLQHADAALAWFTGVDWETLGEGIECVDHAISGCRPQFALDFVGKFKQMPFGDRQCDSVVGFIGESCCCREYKRRCIEAVAGRAWFGGNDYEVLDRTERLAC